ncbi:MAG: F0F1 ATP synthase subunit B [Bacteroidia bacterium]|jgi:F-type H+-transporting ATPase subunit b|nr:F0F1 ATP synthase subunit B [Sphingobacteriaceae bacterium]MBK7310406.1 F0F1 ATP synthase subunit B [Sphingobacteriaceae bacterium]MBK7816484.1 F0F1 ATP synthase subunit B [Sphingobacteriaceae bacterium]MBP9069874.1 F0F1 ATP synthase subunit B [Bacteroidia bacterium]
MSLFILASLVTPGIGLIFWTAIVFLLLLGILGKFAWKPILNAIKTREEGIEKALGAADTALKEVRELKSNNDKMLLEARNERDALMKEARETKESIVAEAKSKAQKDADRIMASAREQIINEKNAAVAELKNQVASLSIEIAEKILRSDLSTDEKQKALVSNLMKDVNLN